MTSPRMTSEQRISPRWPNGMVVRVRPLFVRGLFYDAVLATMPLCAGLVCAVCAPDNLAADEREIRMLNAQVARLEKAA